MECKWLGSERRSNFYSLVGINVARKLLSGQHFDRKKPSLTDFRLKK